jgi:hypothetical protein
MSSGAIFVFGVFVFSLVAAALALIVWGIFEDRRSRRGIR